MRTRGDPLELILLVTYVKMVVVALILFAAAYSDIRSRKVPDRFWTLLVLSAAPLLVLEMIHRGALSRPSTFLALCLPAGFMVFALYGYPEPKEVVKGKAVDITFTVIYLLLLAGAAVALFNGEPGMTSRIVFSFVFMMIYFILYSVPIGGTRIIHGGADAKCMVSLAAIFPWYGEILDISFGPFYDLLADQSSMEFFFPFHFSVMLNGALITVLFLVIFLPLVNISKKHYNPLRIFTSYHIKLDEIQGKFVWIYVKEDGKTTKKDPTPDLLKSLKEDGIEEVRVTPKIPFILSLALGFVIQVVIGNLALILVLSLM